MRELLANRNFRRLWTGQLISQIGDGITGLTVLIVVNQLTGSAKAMAAMAISLALPSLLFGLAAGVYVDRWHKRTVMILSDIGRGLLVLAFILVRKPEDVWIFYVVGFLEATIGTLFNPSKTAILPSILQKEQLIVANGLSQMTQVITIVLGASLAGMLVGKLGAWLAFCCDSLTFFVSAAFVAQITVIERPKASRADAGVAAVLRELNEGLAYLFGNRILLAAVTTFAMTMLGAAAVNVLFIPFLTNSLHVRTELLGTVSAVQVVGMLVGGGLVATLAARVKLGHLVSAGVIATGAMIATIAATTSLWPVLIILFIVGISSTPVQAAISTILQVHVPEGRRGRAGSVLNTAISMSSLLSMAFAGALADAIGVRGVFVIAGAIVVASGVLAAFAMNVPVASPNPLKAADV